MFQLQTYGGKPNKQLNILGAFIKIRTHQKKKNLTIGRMSNECACSGANTPFADNNKRSLKQVQLLQYSLRTTPEDILQSSFGGRFYGAWPNLNAKNSGTGLSRRFFFKGLFCLFELSVNFCFRKIMNFIRIVF